MTDFFYLLKDSYYIIILELNSLIFWPSKMPPYPYPPKPTAEDQ